MEAMRPTYPLPTLSQALAVSLSGYHAWRTRPPSRRQREDARLAAEIKAVTVKRPVAGLIHHSDRGSQYCSKEYRKLLQQFKMQSSMSRRGDCCDNAPIESFWGTLKTERTFHRHYQTRQEQKKLGYLSPAAYEPGFIKCKKLRRVFVSTIDDQPHNRAFGIFILLVNLLEQTFQCIDILPLPFKKAFRSDQSAATPELLIA